MSSFNNGNYQQTPGDDYSNNEKQPLLLCTSSPKNLELQLLDRDLAIRQAQASIFQVGDIYRELGVIVESHNIHIDHIAANVEATSRLAKSANMHLLSASRRPSRSQTCCCGLVPILIAIIISLLILVIVLA